MDISWIRSSMKASTIGYAEHRILVDEKGVPCDFEYVEVNPMYEEIAGRSVAELLGRRATEASPEVLEGGFNWVRAYGDVALQCHSIEYTHYSKPLKRNYNVLAFSPEKGFFVTIYFDITKLAKQIEESEQRIRSVLNSAAEGIFGIDAQGRCTFCNKSALRLLGYQSEYQLLKYNMHDAIHYHRPDGTPIRKEDCPVCRACGEGVPIRVDDEFLWRADRTFFPAEIYAYPQVRDGVVQGAVITFFDITERRKAEEELAESNRSKLVLLANLPGVAYRCGFDDGLTMEYLSEGCLELTGYRSEELIGRSDSNFETIMELEDPKEMYGSWRDTVRDTGTYMGEYPIRTKQGKRKWVYEKGQAVTGPDGQITALEGLIIDITERKEKEERILYLNTHDALTGLFNRIYFDDARESLAGPEVLPLSYIVADINGLKLINEVIGYAAGSQLIADVAEVMRQIVRPGDILARTGGDEFSILLPNTDSDTAYRIMKKLWNVCDGFDLKNPACTMKCNLSFGYGTRMTMEQDLDSVRKTAEDYMYKRKLLDRNSAHSNLLESIKTTMYERSRETEEHAERLAVTARAIGRRLGLTQLEMDELELLSVLHDLGKIGIDDRILDKPGPLTEEEQKAMLQHPEIGFRIAMASPELSSIAKYILAHHERWDGTGYPRGWKGTEIPLLSRILAVVDAFDAMTFQRAYRMGMPRSAALAEIRAGAGTQFDPTIVEIFLEVIDGIPEGALAAARLAYPGSV